MAVAANRYAKALVDVLYPESGEAGLEQLRKFRNLLREQPDARRLFENPTVPAERRKGLLKEIGSAFNLDRRLQNFLHILIDRNRLGLLDEVIDAYQKFLDEKMGIVRAFVTAAHPLDAAQRGELASKLETVTGKQIRMEVAVDPSLIGGVVARVGSTIYDGSVRQQLQSFKNRLVGEA
jgi:F-type H+-transporting ATPase subunit delta